MMLTNLPKGKIEINSTDNYNTTRRWFVLALSIWAATIFVAGYYGMFTKVGRIWIPPIVLVSMTVPVWVYYRNESFRRYIWSIDLRYLTAFHLWRIPAGLWFLYCGSQNLLPEQFVNKAGYGDLAVGCLVPLILMLRHVRGKYLVFHLFGLLDFVVAVGTGLTLTVLQVPLMENIATFPTVLIPLYGVCVTGALSIMTLDRLLRKRSSVNLALSGSC